MSIKQTKTVTIFVVEDDFIFINILCEFIESIMDEYQNQGIQIIYKTFYSAKEAAFELQLKPDIILLDYYIMDDNLNPETAAGFLNDIKKVENNIDIVVVSGQENPELIDELFEQGITEYISKDPSSMKKLEPLLKKLINKRFETN